MKTVTYPWIRSTCYAWSSDETVSRDYFQSLDTFLRDKTISTTLRIEVAMEDDMRGDGGVTNDIARQVILKILLYATKTYTFVRVAPVDLWILAIAAASLMRGVEQTTETIREVRDMKGRYCPRGITDFDEWLDVLIDAMTSRDHHRILKDLIIAMYYDKVCSIPNKQIPIWIADLLTATSTDTSYLGLKEIDAVERELSSLKN